MKRFVLAVLLALSASHAAAAGGLVVTDAWLRATPKGAPVAGGYVTVVNTGDAPDRLTGASLAGAATGEVHAMTMENGVMHMSRLADGLAIAPGGRVTLIPGGTHLMFMQPAPLHEGDHLAGTLTFAHAGTVNVTFTVAGLAAKLAPLGGGPTDSETRH